MRLKIETATQPILLTKENTTKNMVQIYNTSVTPAAQLAPVLSVAAAAAAAALSCINNHFFVRPLFGIFTKLFGATNPKSGNDIMLGAATDDLCITFW